MEYVYCILLDSRVAEKNFDRAGIGVEASTIDAPDDEHALAAVDGARGQGEPRGAEALRERSRFTKSPQKIRDTPTQPTICDVCQKAIIYRPVAQYRLIKINVPTQI